jgi:hypothetical protein
MKNVSIISVTLFILFSGAGYAHAGCAIDSPLGTQVTLAASRADALSTVDISWENEQMINSVEHLIKWHSTLPKTPGNYRYLLKYSFDNVTYKKIAGNLVANSNDGTYEYGELPWTPPPVAKTKKIFLQLIVKKLNGKTAFSCTKKVFVVTQDPVSIAIERSKDNITWKRLSIKPIEEYTVNTDTVPTSSTGAKCLATHFYRVLYLSGTGAVLGLGSDSISILNTSDQINKVAGSGSGYVSDYLGLRYTLTVNIKGNSTASAKIIREGVPATFSGSASAECTGNGQQIAVSLVGNLRLPAGYVFLCNYKNSVHLTGEGYSDQPFAEVRGEMIDECGESNDFYWKKD